MAVKIVDNRLDEEDNDDLMVARETLLSSSVLHPNVVRGSCHCTVLPLMAMLCQSPA